MKSKVSWFLCLFTSLWKITLQANTVDHWLLMYYVREDSRNCCKNDSEHIKILDQSLGVLSSQILLIPRHAKQFFVSDEDNDQAGIVQTVELLHLDFRPKHMLKQLPTIVKRSSFCKSQEHCWEHVLHCYIPFILFWSRFSNYKLINDVVLKGSDH